MPNNTVDLTKIVREYQAQLVSLGEQVLKKRKPDYKDFNKLYYLANTLLGFLEIVSTIEENKANLEAYIAGLRIGEQDDISDEDDGGD